MLRALLAKQVFWKLIQMCLHSSHHLDQIESKNDHGFQHDFSFSRLDGKRFRENGAFSIDAPIQVLNILRQQLGCFGSLVFVVSRETSAVHTRILKIHFPM